MLGGLGDLSRAPAWFYAGAAFNLLWAGLLLALVVHFFRTATDRPLRWAAGTLLFGFAAAPALGLQVVNPGERLLYPALLCLFAQALVPLGPAGPTRGMSRPVAALAAIGIAQGIATIATAFALASLVVAVVRGSDLLAPLAWTGGLFAARALLGALSETVAARAGAAVATGLREQLLAAWAARGERGLPSRTGALTLAVQGTSTVEPYVARYLPALVGPAVVPALAIACLVVVDWPSAAIVVGTVWLLPPGAAFGPPALGCGEALPSVFEAGRPAREATQAPAHRSQGPAWRAAAACTAAKSTIVEVGGPGTHSRDPEVTPDSAV